MSFRVTTYSLSALQPIKLDYKFNSSEELESNLNVLDNRLKYYTHTIFNNFSDVAVSKKNFLALTSIQDLQTVFKNKNANIDINRISGNFYLQPLNNPIGANDNVKTKNSLLFVGGTGRNALFTTSPVKDNIVELLVDGQYVYVEKHYPYTLKLTESPLEGEDYRLQLFTVEFHGESILLKSVIDNLNTTRYVSFSVDRQLRAVGLNLNKTVLNQYLFKPVFVSKGNVPYDFNPTIKEVRYYNSLQDVKNRKELTIKTTATTNTHLLVSCVTKDLTTLSVTPVNIAITKTKYGAEGTFNTEL